VIMCRGGLKKFLVGTPAGGSTKGAPPCWCAVWPSSKGVPGDVGPSGMSWSTSMHVIPVEVPSWLRLGSPVLPCREGGVGWFWALRVGVLETGGWVSSISKAASLAKSS